MAKFSVDINTYFTIYGDSKQQVEDFVRANFFTADIDSDELVTEKNDYGIEIVEVQ